MFFCHSYVILSVYSKLSSKPLGKDDIIIILFIMSLSLDCRADKITTVLFTYLNAAIRFSIIQQEILYFVLLKGEYLLPIRSKLLKINHLTSHTHGRCKCSRNNIESQFVSYVSLSLGF